ncbi:PAS domain-containing sensor histidine kinase [Spirosoma profusum]|nr:PAS domain S-box protein [Spirosoma profusum]
MTGDQGPFDSTQKLTQQLDIDFALQAAGLGVWELDPVTSQVIWDDRCRELFGLAKHNYLSYEQAIQYIHTDDVSRVSQAVQWAMTPQSNGLFDETYRTIGADDGQLRWVRFHGRSYFSEAGEIYRFAGVAQEVTQQILTQQRETRIRQDAQRQQRIYEAIAGSTPDLMYVFDLNYRFIYANQALLNMWGSSWEKSIGKDLLANGYEPWHAQMHEREIDQVVATKQSIRGEVSFPHATLGKRIYDYVFAPVLNERGEVEAVAGTTRDITDIKQAEETLRESEKNYRTLFESMQEGYTVCEAIRDPSGKMIDYRFLQVNPAFGKLTGLEPAQTHGKTAWDMLPGLDEKWYAIYQQVIDTHQTIRVEDYIPPLNEWYNLTVFWYADEQFAVLFDEITERKRAEAALRVSEERFRLFVTASSDAVYTMSADWRQMNQLVGKTFLANTQAPNRDWLLKYIPVEDHLQVETAIEEAITTKSVFELEHQVIQADGTVGWTMSRAVPILDEQGHLLEWFGTASDVTERKRAEEALRQSEERYRHLSAELEERVKARTLALSQANADLKRSNDNLQQFAYVASHDLQEPLRKIQSFSTLLTQQLDTQLNEVTKDHLQRITAAGARMSALIRDLLAYSRISTRQQSFGLVSLEAIVANVLTTLDWEISQSGAQISVDTLPMTNGDESQLGQLFQNLLTNAIKFVIPGQSPQIRIEYFKRTLIELPPDVHPGIETPLYHQISVKDQGVGFDIKFRDRIFQVFQRLHSKSEYPGTGVGLAICQRVVENHGGAITASSYPDQGTSFDVYLPA